jgi:hypothetical protein
MQVCQQGADYVELFIYLGEPCHVCQLLLTVSHGAEDSSYPATLDVRVGSSIDSLKLVVEVLVSILPHWFSGFIIISFYFAPAVSSSFFANTNLVSILLRFGLVN